MTPADLLRAAGEALYGEQFKSALGRTVGYDEKQVRRWLSGDAVPPGVWAELAALCAARLTTLRGLVKPLHDAAKAGE